MDPDRFPDFADLKDMPLSEATPIAFQLLMDKLNRIEGQLEFYRLFADRKTISSFYKSMNSLVGHLTERITGIERSLERIEELVVGEE